MLNKQIAISFISLFVMGFTGIFTIPILTRILTVDEMGHLFLILAIIGIIQIFDGIRPVITYILNQNKYSETTYIKVFENVNLIFMLPSSILIFVVLHMLELPIIEVLMFVFAFIFYSLMSVQWGILDTKNSINYTSIVRASLWVMVYLLFILFAYNKVPQEYYVLPLLLMYMLLYLIFKIKVNQVKQNLIINSVISKSESKILNRNVFFKIMENIKIQLVVIVFLAMDKITIPFLLGYQQFAIYSVSSELALKGYLVNSTLKRVFFPYLADSKNKPKLLLFLKRSHYVFIITLFLIILIGMFGTTIVNIYAGSKYATSGNLLSVLLLVFPANILGTIGVVILHINGDFRTHYLIHRDMAIPFIIIFVLLIYFFGLSGAVLGILLSRSIDLYMYFIAINKYVSSCSKIEVFSIIFLYQLIVLMVFFKYYYIVYLLVTLLSMFFILLNKRIM